MRTAVTSTSIAAYRQLKTKQTKAERLARLILARTERGQRTWDRKAAQELGVTPNAVSARRNEIKRDGIVLDGVHYRLQEAGKAKDPHTNVKVNVYSLVLANDKPQLELFK